MDYLKEGFILDPRKRKRPPEFMLKAGRVAADTIGWLTAGKQGVKVADKAYTALTQQLGKDRQEPKQIPDMAGRSSNVRHKRKRKGSKKSFKKKKTSKFTKRDGSDNYQTAHLRSGRKVSSKAKGRKTLKLSKKFKKAVKQVIRNFTPKGYYTERYYGRYTPGNMENRIYDLGLGWNDAEGGYTTVNGVSSAMFFDPVKVLDAASVLFHGKSPSGKKAIVDGMFDEDYAEVDVLRQWVRMEFKNNTSRDLVMKLYTWQLRNDTKLKDGDFSAEWAAAASSESFSLVPNNQNGNLNRASAPITEIGMNPNFSNSIRKRFSIEEKEVRLEAGKSFVHLVQGPSMLYNYSSFKAEGVFNGFQKMCKGVCMALSTDMTGTTQGVTPEQAPVLTSNTGHQHRWTKLPSVPNSEINHPYGILVETTYNYVIRMPEQSGLKVQSNVPGTNQILDNRLSHPYCVKTWNKIDLSAGIFDKTDEDPSLGVTFGV